MYESTLPRATYFRNFSSYLVSDVSDRSNLFAGKLYRSESRRYESTLPTDVPHTYGSRMLTSRMFPSIEKHADGLLSRPAARGSLWILHQCSHARKDASRRRRRGHRRSNRTMGRLRREGRQVDSLRRCIAKRGQDEVRRQRLNIVVHRRSTFHAMEDNGHLKPQS